MSTQKIKLIWDFRGENAAQTAIHHENHLKEFLNAQDAISLNITGHANLSSYHSIAFLVVEENEMPKLRDLLRPHRGEVYEQ